MEQSAPNVSLTFPTGTSSSFESSANVKTGVIYNESKLEIKGKKVIVISAGPDGEFGNDDDIRSDKIKRQKKND